MKRLAIVLWAALLALALLGASSGVAAPVAETPGVSGSRVVLTDEVRHCVGGAHYAEWRSADGQVVVPGCWVLRGRVVQVAFADGDAVRVPLSAFVQSKESRHEREDHRRPGVI